MRIVWKDSRRYQTYQYRGYTIKRCTKGWITNVPGDKYIYQSAEIAHNAVDKMLGGETRKANPKRHRLGVHVVGEKSGEHQCG